ncbi:MAG: hypothetical protein PUB94_01480 [Oscillospiraceae bacterium]|nr:hypothetical protein [Oscillospiraceae bacterium]
MTAETKTVHGNRRRSNSVFFTEEQFQIDEIQYGSFYYDGLAVLICKDCEFEIKRPKSDSRKHRFISVRFTPGGKSYDYLCDDTDIKVGDTITVPADGEEKEATVVNIFEKTESETSLPIKAYKSLC